MTKVKFCYTTKKTFLTQVVLCLTCDLDIMELVNFRKILKFGAYFLGHTFLGYYNLNYFLAKPR